MRQLRSQDASFLYLDSRGAHLTLTGVYVYQQPRRPHAPLGYDDVVRHVRSRLASIPLFRRKLVRPPLDLDYPYWVDDPDFDLGQHIHRFRGPAPRNRAELYALVAQLHACPLDLNRPPWRMDVVERLGAQGGLPKNGFAIVTRYHHSAIDGASGNDLILGLHGTRPQDIRSTAAEPDRESPRDPPGTLGLLARAAVNNLAGQTRLARSLARTVPRLLSAPWFGRNSGGTATVPPTRFNRSVSRERVFHAVPIPLAEIEAVRDAVPGVTVNDVVLSVCAGGLRRWLGEREELPGQSLVAMVPVNMRQARENADGNQLAMIFMPIHTDIGDPLDRLQAVHRYTRKAKAQVREGLQKPMLELAESLPSLALSSTGRAITGLGAGRLVRLCNCIITNVPSPHRTLYLGRARMVYTTGAGPILDGLGLIISLFTYRGQVDFSITSCPEMLAAPDRLGRHFQEEFEALSKATERPASG